MRIILFTGKGGVGKSTTAAATAALIAQQGRKTLLVSADLAHNLSDIMARPVGDACLEITENLCALEVDILHEIRENWQSIAEYMTSFLSYIGLDDVVAEEVALLPGMDMILLLARILREIESGRFETVVIDCPPTAGTLQMLIFTDSAGAKLNKIIEAERLILKLIRPVGRHIKGVKQLLPEDQFYRTMATVIRDIGRLGDMLRDPKQSSIRLVLNPDKVAVAETRRAYTYCALFGFSVDGIFINKVYPEELAKGYLGPWCEIQKEQVKVIEESFLHTRILPVRYLKTEPVGVERICDLGRVIYGDTDPHEVLSEGRTVQFEKRNNKTVLVFTLPHQEKTDLDIGRKGNDLIISAGAYSRVFMLPDSLASSEVEDADYKDHKLTVTFA